MSSLQEIPANKTLAKMTNEIQELVKYTHNTTQAE